MVHRVIYYNLLHKDYDNEILNSSIVNSQKQKVCRQSVTEKKKMSVMEVYDLFVTIIGICFCCCYNDDDNEKGLNL